jgi:hypothetical protein
LLASKLPQHKKAGVNLCCGQRIQQTQSEIAIGTIVEGERNLVWSRGRYQGAAKDLRCGPQSSIGNPASGEASGQHSSRNRKQ